MTDTTHDDLVRQLRDLGDHGSYEPHMHHAAADRIEELEAKLAKVTAAYRIEVMQRGPWVSHEDFDRHIREITGGRDD
jgi:hypothetical protein